MHYVKEANCVRKIWFILIKSDFAQVDFPTYINTSLLFQPLQEKIANLCTYGLWTFALKLNGFICNKICQRYYQNVYFGGLLHALGNFCLHIIQVYNKRALMYNPVQLSLKSNRNTLTVRRITIWNRTPRFRYYVCEWHWMCTTRGKGELIVPTDVFFLAHWCDVFSLRKTDKNRRAWEGNKIYNGNR